MATDDQLRAFALMPFGDGFDAVYGQILVPALSDAGYTVTRADSVIDQQNVLRDIVTGIDRSALVVADMTGLNPNVFYELGLVHGLGVPTILITQAIDEVPFDLRGYRVQEYSTRFDQADDLKSTLHEIAVGHANGDVSFGSPISDFLPQSSAAARLVAQTGEPPGSPEASEASDTEEAGGAVEDDEGPGGFLDLLVAMNGAMNAVGPISAEIGNATEEVGSKVERHTARIEKLATRQDPGVLTEAHRIATSVASDLDVYSEKLRGPITRLEEQASILQDAAPALASRLDPNDEDDHQQLVEYRDSLTELQSSVVPTISQLTAYLNEIRGLRGITTKLDRAVDRTASQLDRLISTLETFDAFCARGIGIVDEKLDDGGSETAAA